MAKSFSKKILRVGIRLMDGSFKGKGGANTAIYEGLETHVEVDKPGDPDQNKAVVEIYNMSLDAMQNLTSLAFKPLQAKKNLITVFAGDEQEGLSMVFAGEIETAYADFSGAPTVKFRIEAACGAYPQLKASPPVAVKGSQTAASLIGQFAGEIGYSFENNGVTASVRNMVLNGSPIQKMRSVANAVGCELLIDDNRVRIQPRDKALGGGNAVLLSPEAGMIGYPSFNNDGIVVKCLYNPDLELGGLVEVKSVVPGASGTWKITHLKHELVAFSNGPEPWFSEVEASPLDAPPKDAKSKGKSADKVKDKGKDKAKA